MPTMKRNPTKTSSLVLAAISALILAPGCSTNRAAEGKGEGDASGEVSGHVMGAGAPIAGATVTLYAASESAPAELANGQTDADGAFKLDAGHADGRVLYLVAKGGTPKAAGAKGAGDALALMTLLKTTHPKAITINELTTVASVFAAAQFINGGAISGEPLGLRIAAGNVPNFVDLATGGWGKVIVDPLNSFQTTTLANFNTLGSLVSASFMVASDDWRARYLKIATPPGGATPKNTLEAMADISRAPWASTKEFVRIVRRSLPATAESAGTAQGTLRAVSRLRPGRLRPQSLLLGRWKLLSWTAHVRCGGQPLDGQNWMPGSQSGVIHNIGGGTVKLAPNGTALSPAITGFTGMGVDGIGWGTGVALDKVWVTSFNGSIGVMDFNGNPIGKESDFPTAGKNGGLQGVGIAPNGDVWIADAVKDQLLYFPGGRVKDGRIVQVKGLNSPFSIVIDNQNCVWVGNALSYTIVRFPADDPSKAESINAGGVSVRGIALDSKGNVWSASLIALDFPPPVIPRGSEIMTQFQIAGLDIFHYATAAHPSGVVQLTRPDGSHPVPKGFSAPPINVPWGLSIDGNDDVWFGNFLGRGVILMAGEDTKEHPVGTKTGDVIHQFQSSSIQMITEVAIDPAGNVWAANNWNQADAVLAYNPDRLTSTQGGGSGITVIYGVAAPVKTPLLGTVRKY